MKFRFLLPALLCVTTVHAAPFTMEQVLSYPYSSGMVASQNGGHIA